MGEGGYRIRSVAALSLKELRSLARDPVLLLLILYTFTFAIVSVANGVQTTVRNASVAVVDEDRSTLSERLTSALLPPYFKPAEVIPIDRIDPDMDAGRYTFVLDIPSNFQRDVLAGRKPALQLNVDATAMTMAGNGVRYIEAIVTQEIADFIGRHEVEMQQPFTVVTRARFNPNLEAKWFMAVMQLIQNVTMMGLILTGAAVLREREHGTIEHLLVMPLGASEIMISKILANGGVIVAAALLSLFAVVKIWIGVPIQGSPLLFALGAAVYLFSVTALGILLSTVAQSMQQFGLLCIPVFVIMNLLSGGVTPLESMPPILANIMQFSPSTHYVSLAKAVLFRDAGLDVIWPDLAKAFALGFAFFTLGLLRFRASIAAQR